MADKEPETKETVKPREERRKRHRSRSRSRSHDRRRRKHSSRSRSPRRKKRSRSRSAKRREEGRELEKKYDAVERRRSRHEYIVFVHQVHPKVDEKDLFDFFSHVGRVADIRLIRDQRTLKSKGLCYIEFWEQESVNKAIALNGFELCGHPISIQMTQADRIPEEEVDMPLRLSVGNLHSSVSEEDLRPMFEPFGMVDSVQLLRDENGKSKCFGYVTFRRQGEAKQAVQALDNMEIAGKPIHVSIVDGGVPTAPISNQRISDLDDDGSMAMSGQVRQALMQKLQRGSDLGIPGVPSGAGNVPPAIAQATELTVPRIQRTTCVVVKNMFDPRTETEPEWDLDIKEDVQDECTKNGCAPRHIFVDKDAPQGVVYLRFLDQTMAAKVVATFNGRWFASRQIKAEHVTETTYEAKFPGSA